MLNINSTIHSGPVLRMSQTLLDCGWREWRLSFNISQ